MIVFDNKSKTLDIPSGLGNFEIHTTQYMDSTTADRVIESAVTSANSYTDEKISGITKVIYDLAAMDMSGITELCTRLRENPSYFYDCDIVYDKSGKNYKIYSINSDPNYFNFYSSIDSGTIKIANYRGERLIITENTYPVCKNFMLKINDLTGGTPTWKIKDNFGSYLKNFKDRDVNTLINIYLWFDNDLAGLPDRGYGIASAWRWVNSTNTYYFYFDNFRYGDKTYKCAYSYDDSQRQFATIYWEEI